MTDVLQDGGGVCLHVCFMLGHPQLLNLYAAFHCIQLLVPVSRHHKKSPGRCSPGVWPSEFRIRGKPMSDGTSADHPAQPSGVQTCIWTDLGKSPVWEKVWIPYSSKPTILSWQEWFFFLKEFDLQLIPNAFFFFFCFIYCFICDY